MDEQGAPSVAQTEEVSLQHVEKKDRPFGRYIGTLSEYAGI